MRTKENFSKGAFENPKLHLVCMDVMEYFGHTSQLFDSIIIDLVDAVSEDELKWLASVCKKAINSLYHGKVLVNAGGSYKNMMKLIDYIRDRNHNLTFDYSVFTVPSFQQPWYLMAIGKY
jgi:predicted membrane-bound spermidine synthase